MRTTTTPGSNVLALAPRVEGDSFATAGSDHAVRVYDEITGKLTAVLDRGDGVETMGHSNNVYGLAWSDIDRQVCIQTAAI